MAKQMTLILADVIQSRKLSIAKTLADIDAFKDSGLSPVSVRAVLAPKEARLRQLERELASLVADAERLAKGSKGPGKP